MKEAELHYSKFEGMKLKRNTLKSKARGWDCSATSVARCSSFSRYLLTYEIYGVMVKVMGEPVDWLGQRVPDTTSTLF